MDLLNMVNIDLLLDEVFISGDVETDGPAPGINSMLSAGLVAFTLRKGILSEWEGNFMPLRDAVQDIKTMRNFWDKEPEAWAACRTNPQPAEVLMPSMKAWVDHTKSFHPKGKMPVFCAYPAGFDFTFIYWYSIKFLGESPFGFQAMDMKTYMQASRRVPFRQATKKHMPKRWFDGNKHPHIALDDAREQAHLCIAMMRENLSAEIAKVEAEGAWNEFCDMLAPQKETSKEESK